MASHNTLARRSILGGALAASAAALPAMPAVDPINDAASKLAAAMQARHGGRWEVTIDHEMGFA
jgi:hypothetical protein